MIGKLTKLEIEELLEDSVFGHLGCNDGHNSYVYPTNYIYERGHIICHSQDGFKNSVMRKNKRVCFQVDDITDHGNWKSVMLHGDYEEIHEPAALKKFIDAFINRRLFIKKSESAISEDTTSKAPGADTETNMAVIFRILIDEKTGLFEAS